MKRMDGALHELLAMRSEPGAWIWSARRTWPQSAFLRNKVGLRSSAGRTRRGPPRKRVSTSSICSVRETETENWSTTSRTRRKLLWQRSEHMSATDNSVTLPLELRSLDVGKTVLLTLHAFPFWHTSDVSSLNGEFGRYSFCVVGMHRRSPNNLFF